MEDWSRLKEYERVTGTTVLTRALLIDPFRFVNLRKQPEELSADNKHREMNGVSLSTGYRKMDDVAARDAVILEIQRADSSGEMTPLFVEASFEYLLHPVLCD